MSYIKWLIATFSLILIFAILIILVNLWDDSYGVRLILFSKKNEITQTYYQNGLNQRMLNAEIVFRSPQKFDSFLFGSSRVGVIDVSGIKRGRFYNMSYSRGLPAEHLAIIKAFLKKRVEIKNVVIGLDDFCFNLSATENKNELSNIMHPDANGPNRVSIFAMYFFRNPRLSKLEWWFNRTFKGRIKEELVINNNGLNLSWREKEKLFYATGKPIFQDDVRKYEPVKYDPRQVQEAFAAIGELIKLSQKHNFSLIFFISPLYETLYLINAQAMMDVKKRLAQMTDYYDFSGFNSVTTNAVNYYETSHYRYLVGDMIIKNLYDGGINVPDDFGVLVTRKNINQHIQKQEFELEKYKSEYSLK